MMIECIYAWATCFALNKDGTDSPFILVFAELK